MHIGKDNAYEITLSNTNLKTFLCQKVAKIMPTKIKTEDCIPILYFITSLNSQIHKYENIFNAVSSTSVTVNNILHVFCKLFKDLAIQRFIFQLARSLQWKNLIFGRKLSADFINHEKSLLQFGFKY